MSLTETRLTRTSTSSGTDGRTHATSVTSTSVASRRLVGVAVAATRAWRAVAAWWARAFQWARRTVRPAGVLVVLGATGGLGFGILFGWVEWMVAGAASLVLLVASIPFLFGSRSYDVGLVLAHERIVSGDDLAGEVVVRNNGSRLALPGRIDIPVGAGLVEFGVPLLRPGHTVSQPLEIPGLRRGVVVVGPATTVRSDPVGLFRREHAFADEHEVYVHPRTVTLPSTSSGLIRDLEGSATRRTVDADMSFHAIRPYVSGDSRRHIHWKSTAKTGRLMVRQYEESRRSHMAIVLGVARPEFADDDEFELAVSCAASLGLRAVRESRDVALVTGSEIPRVVKSRMRAIRHLPADSPRTLLDGCSTIEQFDNTMNVVDVCRLTSESTERVSIAFVVVGSPVSLSTLQKASLAFAADTAVVAVVCDERAHPRMQTLSSLTVMTVGTIDDLSGLLLRGAST
jgi:uncharacterized protein (DUF58 family)